MAGFAILTRDSLKKCSSLVLFIQNPIVPHVQLKRWLWDSETELLKESSWTSGQGVYGDIPDFPTSLHVHIQYANLGSDVSFENDSVINWPAGVSGSFHASIPFLQV